MPASEDKILIDAIEFLGHCGVPHSERSALQRFSVSVELGLNLRPAAGSDRLEETVDYEAVSHLVVSVGKSKSFVLLETMAEEIASELLKGFKIRSVKILLKKSVPPVEAIKGFFAVEILRMSG
ncbi:MAG: dihydroneopterin aldolase [Nitrospirae bacterium]|nr:dihydroneopterin aldolase [Nitrospirota bacterium]MBI3595217.1 dihydroneopterin aldolase [Nitrospirota bacterium]